MIKIIADRLTAQIDDEVVVFLIGMRINRAWKVHKWLPGANVAGSVRSISLAWREAQ